MRARVRESNSLTVYLLSPGRRRRVHDRFTSTVPNNGRLRGRSRLRTIRAFLYARVSFAGRD